MSTLRKRSLPISISTSLSFEAMDVPNESKTLLIALSLFKILKFLRDGLRLRTACDLRIDTAKGGVKVKRPKDGFIVPSLDVLERDCRKLVKAPPRASPIRPLPRSSTRRRNTMLAISLTFPAKRFHATPWGRQVNEGAVEWPPSPWRLLRSLVAVWHHKFPDVTEPEIRDLVERLTPPPLFCLPSAAQGHTRHYMPLVSGEKTKVFDTFVAVEPDEAVVAVWPERRTDAPAAGRSYDGCSRP